jgi:hypothetical protein
LGVSGVYYDNLNIRGLLLLLDVFAILNMWVTSKVQRKNNQTKMYTKKAIYSWMYYKKNGLLWDIICIVIPTIVDLVNPDNQYFLTTYHMPVPIGASLRLLQLRHLSQYFTYRHETKMGVSYSMIFYRIYQMVILVCGAACYGIRISRNEQAIAKYYMDAEKNWWTSKGNSYTGDMPIFESSKLWGSMSYGITLPRSGHISVECRSMEINKGPSNISVAQSGWIGQAYKYRYGLAGLNMNQTFVGLEDEPGNTTDYRYDPTSQWYHLGDEYKYDPPKYYFSGVDFDNNNHFAMSRSTTGQTLSLLLLQRF